MNKGTTPFENTIRATWINIWIASSESHWFNPDNLHGTRVFYNGKKMSINWDDMGQARQHLQQMRDAGIDVVLFDLTNGFHDFIIERSRQVGAICRELGLKFAFAAGNDDDEGFEYRAKLTWDEFCGEDAPFRDCYFTYDGKPALVLYVVREQYERLHARKGGYLARFTHGWASGEDPDIDKWGWQLTPSVGSVSSDNVMYITSSLWWDRSAEQNWYKSLSYLDYNFLKASQAKPRLLIVGSFDDVCERNSWMPVDTADAPMWLHQKDPYGNIDPMYYYRRVCDWLSDEGPKTIPGGSLPDGAYRMQLTDGRCLMVDQREDITDTEVIADRPQALWQNLVWLYHLGNGEYRVIRLFAGRSLAEQDGMLVQAEDQNIPHQRWILRNHGDGWKLQNVATGNFMLGSDALWHLGAEITIPKNNAWRIQFGSKVDKFE